MQCQFFAKGLEEKTLKSCSDLGLGKVPASLHDSPAVNDADGDQDANDDVDNDDDDDDDDNDDDGDQNANDASMMILNRPTVVVKA